MCILIEFFYKVERTLVVRTVPDLNINYVFLLLHSKFSGECCSKPLLCKLNENFSIGLSNEHGRDTDASARSVVTHNDTCYIFHSGVDYDK